jgi:hypothetical protein
MLIITALLIGSPFSVAAKIIIVCRKRGMPTATIAPLVFWVSVFTVLAMHDQLIPKLHRHALKLAAGGAVNIDRRNLFHFLDYQIGNVYSVLRAFCVNQSHSSITSRP